jgi:hypothetical protein
MLRLIIYKTYFSWMIGNTFVTCSYATRRFNWHHTNFRIQNNYSFLSNAKSSLNYTACSFMSCIESSLEKLFTVNLVETFQRVN